MPSDMLKVSHLQPWDEPPPLTREQRQLVALPAPPLAREDESTRRERWLDRERQRAKAAQLKPLVPDREDAQVWDRLEDEPVYWFNRFRRYLSMPTGQRFFVAVYNEERAARGSPRAATVPERWKVKIERFRWRARAEAFDAHQIEAQRKADEKRREDARQFRLTQAAAIRNKAIEALNLLSPRLLASRPNDLLNAFKLAHEIERKEYGEVDERIEHQGSEKKPFKVYLGFDPGAVAPPMADDR